MRYGYWETNERTSYSIWTDAAGTCRPFGAYQGIYLPAGTQPEHAVDWNNIIRTIRENHEHAAESAPIERPMSNDKKVQRFLQALKFKSNPIEEFQRFFCDEMQIPFDHLSVDEHKVMKDVFKRSKLLKALPNRKK